MGNIEQQKVISMNKVFDSRFLDSNTLYLHHFNEVPSLHFRNKIDGEKAFEAIRVDLGFLLITFFIFTTAMSKPTGLKIYLPKSVPDSSRIKIPRSGALAILLGTNRRIYYYEGADPEQMHLTDLNAIRNIIMDKKKRTDPKKFMVIIKPGRDSDFHTLVSIMDEMTINAVKRYAMVDLDPIEYGLIQLK